LKSQKMDASWPAMLQPGTSTTGKISGKLTRHNYLIENSSNNEIDRSICLTRNDQFWGQIQSPWLRDKVDSGIGLRSTLAYCRVAHGKCIYQGHVLECVE
jgi:hypothetical protein